MLQSPETWEAIKINEKNYQTVSTKGEKEGKTIVIIIIIIIIIITITKNANKKRSWSYCILEHNALPMNLLSRKLIYQIFWFPKYTLLSHQELICYHWQNKLDYDNKSLNNLDFIVVNN